MDLDHAVKLVRDALVLALLVSSPMLLVGLAVGIFVSLLQAVTQIQEQTLTFIPKIAAMGTSAIFFMPWMSHRLMVFAHQIFSDYHFS